MKKALLISTVAALTSIATTKAQNVYIPDGSFKILLLNNPNINTNSDAEIQVSEAAAFSDSLYISNNISDLTGIEAFTAITRLYVLSNPLLTSLDISANTGLTYLNCSGNGLTSLNISANTALTYLNCGSNSLTSLNVSANTALIYLACNSNSLPSLDVSANTALTNLACGFNSLDSLNISANTGLTFLSCGYNSLTSLDVSANTALTTLYCSFCYPLISLNVKNGNNINFNVFEANLNQNLSCIQVDDAVWSQANWTAPSNIDSTAYFSENCPLDINDHSLNDKVIVYPNPTTGSVFLSDNFTVTLTDINGKVISIKENTNLVDISSHSTGMYFISLTDKKGQIVSRSKLAKE